MKRNLTISALFTLLFSLKILAQTPQYCASKGVSPWEQWIERVSISSNNFGNSSVKEGYGNFTNLTGASLKRGIGNLITISPKSSWNGDPRNANMFWRAWVDFNADGDFTDEGEMAISRQVVIQSQIFLDNEAAFTPPNTAKLGKTRLRIAMKVGSYPEPCETFDRGEVEDYAVEITEGNQLNLPDLTLANLNIQTPSVLQGQVLNYLIDIKNIGTGNATGNFTVKAYISTDNVLSADDAQNGVIPTGNFAAGFSVSQVPGASNIPTTLPVGQYFLILKVDADNQITESNENNNTVISATPFTVITGQTSSDYCISKGFAPWELWVSRVQFNTFNNASDKFKDFSTLGYSDFSNLTTTISKGQTYLLNISPGLSWSDNLPYVYCRAWIDYNGNKIFENTELVFQNNNVDPFSANIRVPSSAVIGNVRMRVALKWGGYPEPCEVFARGEVEDYTINIMNPTIAGSDTLRLVGISGDRLVRQGEKITLNVSIKNTGTAPSNPNTPLSIYQNQQPFIFKGPPSTYLTIVSNRVPIGRIIQPNETVTVQATFTIFSNFSHITRSDYSGVQYNGTYVVIGNRTDNFGFFPYPYPIVDTLAVPYNIGALLDSADLKIDIIAPDTTFNKNGKYSFTVKITNNGRAAAKDVLTNVGTGYSQYGSGIFILPTVTPQRGTVFVNAPFGAAAYTLWNISSLAPNESLTAFVQYEKFAIPVILPEYIQEVRIASNQIMDTAVLNNVASQRFVLDSTTLPYCTAKGTAPWEQWIQSISLASRAGNSTYPSTAKEGYGDFTALNAANLVRGQGGFLTINPASSWSGDPRNANMFWRAWVDWNDDNDFDDSGEVLAEAGVVISNGVFFDNVKTISVPSNASLGKRRLRIAMKVGGYPSPCEVFERGEVEDYSVNVIEMTTTLQPLIIQGDLRAILIDEKVRMDWVQQSFNIRYFDIEKSTDDVHFESIKSIPTSANNYHVAYDDTPTEGVSFYRLKIHLMNGQTQSTNPQKVNYEKMADFTVFPNPANEDTYIDLKKYADKEVNITISDVTGQIILNKTIEKAISEPQRLDISSLKNGTYFITLKCNNKRDVVRKIQIMK
jgi:GEVED domain/Secretion system C-terminal sorting domain/CARDB